MHWSEGYVSEIVYTQGFYGELSPSNLNFATFLCNGNLPSTDRSFSYCELACGQGLSTNLLAATYPESTFYATDFNPSHIASAQKLANSANLQNVHFFPDSFKEFLHRDLPEFDYICLHGIYSWITPENRQAIVDFIQKYLKIGGLAYISYNAMPGWAAAAPIQALMLRHGQYVTGSMLHKAKTSLEFVNKLIELNAAYFTQNPALKSRCERLMQQNMHYVVHEYFNQNWHPLYFDEVVKELSAAKLTFVGSAHILDLIDLINLPEAFQQELAQILDPIYREQLRDYFLNVSFRRDIFSKGNYQTNLQERIEIFQSLPFTTIVPLSTIQYEHTFPVGQIVLEEAVYKPICEALSTETLTTKQLQCHPLTNTISFQNLYQSLIVLTGLGYIHPVLSLDTFTQRKQSTDAFNMAVLTRALYSQEISFLASPLIGTGIQISRLDQLFVLAKLRNENLATFVWQIISSQGETMIKDGKQLPTPEENIAHLQELSIVFSKETVPILQKLGII